MAFAQVPVLLLGLTGCTAPVETVSDPQLEPTRVSFQQSQGLQHIKLNRPSPIVIELDVIDSPLSQLEPEARQKKALELAAALYAVYPKRDVIEQVGVDLIVRKTAFGVFPTNRTDSYTFTAGEIKQELRRQPPR